MLDETKPTAGSLFSGIGGLDLGLERAGWEIKWQIEIDEWCQRVLAKHWPDVPKYGDVREVSEGDLEPVDLVAGGFPCQPVSRAGRRKGSSDSEWLWPEFLRIVSEVRPRFVLVENTPGLLHHGLSEVLSSLSSCGYDAEWDCLPAAAFGARHIRDRFYLLAYPSEGRYRPSQAALFTGWPSSQLHGRWAAEPDVGRVAHGVPSRVDRLRGLGNAVVPQIAEGIGKGLIECL